MNSPITGKPMIFTKEASELTFRKESFPYIHHNYLCKDTGERFTTTDLDEADIQQVYNQYRQKYNIPFPDEIKALRAKYDLSARKMAEILGFGINVYRNYEQGEVPNLSNAKLIRLAADPKKFKELVILNTSLKEKKRAQLLTKIEAQINNEIPHPLLAFESSFLNLYESPNLNTGYKKINLLKLEAVVKYFAKKLQPWKTQLNKLLFYSDFLMFKRSCYSISGIAYRAIQMGPVPQNYDVLYSYLAQKKAIEINTTIFDNNAIGEQFFAVNNLEETTELSNEELNVLQQVEEKFKNFSTKELINYSHKEKAWLDNCEEKKLISYQYAFDIDFK